MSPFHAKDGWYFERLEDGSVRIQHKMQVTVDLDADTWASAVCSVSADGENARRFEAALRFHQGMQLPEFLSLVTRLLPKDLAESVIRALEARRGS